MSEGIEQIRIHIGNISPKLQEAPELLLQRIGKFVSIEDEQLELHTKPLKLNYFAYLNIKCTSEQFDNLKRSLNGMVFMGMKLNINKAKDNTYNLPHESKQKAKEQLIRDKIHKSRLEKINDFHTIYPSNSFNNNLVTSPIPTSYSLSPHTFNSLSGNTKLAIPKHTLIGTKSYGSTLDSKFGYSKGKGQVVKGSHRNHPRKNKNSQSLRILVNGNVINIEKSHKTKLWGIENKNLSDLTYKFDDSTDSWIAGNNHVVEKCSMSGKQALGYGANATHEDKMDIAVDDDELNKNKSVLASVLSKFDFDKPVDIEEDEKDGDKFDYELNGDIANDTNFELVNNAEEIINQSKQQLTRPENEVYYDENDNNEFENVNDKFTTEAIVNEYEKDHQNNMEKKDTTEATVNYNETHYQNENLNESEDLPKADQDTLPQKNTNTENLRSLLNESSTFKLALSSDDEDIDESKNIETPELPKQKQPTQQVQIPNNANIKKFGLFWYHHNSPFLITQSQLAKIGSVDDKVNLPELEDPASDESKFENWFWSNRSEVSRECKIRKRDVLKKFRRR